MGWIKRITITHGGNPALEPAHITGSDLNRIRRRKQAFGRKHEITIFPRKEGGPICNICLQVVRVNGSLKLKYGIFACKCQNSGLHMAATNMLNELLKH